MADVELEVLGPGRFRVKGPLTFSTVTHVLAAGEKLFAEHDHLDLDLSGVDSTDSAGLALLVEWVGWAHREKRHLKFHHVPKQVIALAHISEVDALLPMA